MKKRNINEDFYWVRFKRGSEYNKLYIMFYDEKQDAFWWDTEWVNWSKLSIIEKVKSPEFDK
jgi:hypothetical protein